MIFQTISNNDLNTLTNISKKNHDVSSDVSVQSINRDIKSLSSVIKLAKSKKSSFAKSNLFGIEFLIPRTKEALIYLQKSFTKVLIL